MSETPPAPIDVLCKMNENGLCTWISSDKAITEFDPFFICAYGYQDQSGTNGESHLIWVSIAGAPSTLQKFFPKRSDAMTLLDQLRQLKKRH